jgi:hypothetical protein
VGLVLVVVALVLVQDLAQVGLVPDECAVQELATAFLRTPFRRDPAVPDIFLLVEVSQT